MVFRVILKLDQFNAWELDNCLDLALDTLRYPPGDMPGGDQTKKSLTQLGEGLFYVAA